MNIFKHIISAITFPGIMLMLIPGCAKQPIKTTKLFTPHHAMYQTTQKNITLQATVLDEKESNQLFDGYIPCAKKLRNQPRNCTVKTVHIALNNKSNQPVIIHKKDIGLDWIDYKNIYFATSTNKKLIIAGGTVAAGALPFLGISLVGLLTATHGCPCCVLIPLVLGTGSAVLGSAGFFTGSMLWYNSAQKQLHREFRQKVLNDPITIAPQQRKEFFLFIPEQSLPKDFTLTVNDAQTNLPHTTFAVSLYNSSTRTIENQK